MQTSSADPNNLRATAMVSTYAEDELGLLQPITTIESDDGYPEDFSESIAHVENEHGA